ncbi:Crp/Fnr family transcriptional regulator [Skermanella mucosa]|uniref:Crp/Fnr family transcriptional regulator n=1 Tax=Skermanella mucosa TaxID=1789672 RepID=UPI00192C0AE5|nr:Crp/Fnr family transcriptional regulator [Skermanella mucosa]UEM20838.1 Crp/Fnr family transcriptional regulator [Skermanella mucosa]
MIGSSILKDAELFQGLEPDALDTIFNAGQIRQIKKRTRIFNQGAPARNCHLLIEGRTKIVQSGPDGEQVLIHLVGPGEMYGIAAVFLSTGYPADAFAITDCTDLRWPARTIKELMLAHPRVGLNALGIVAARYQDAQHRLREIAHQSVERRIAHAVLRLVQYAGRRVGHYIEIEIPLLRQDMAELAGTSMFTVSRVLNDWEARGIVDASRRRIIVRQLHALVAIAEKTGELKSRPRLPIDYPDSRLQ